MKRSEAWSQYHQRKRVDQLTHELPSDPSAYADGTDPLAAASRILQE